MTDWADDDGFWIAMEPALCAPARPARAQGDVEAILRNLDLPVGASVLGLACGPGAHAIAFAGRGYRVTGLDRSGRLLERARSAAAARGLRIEWVEADMRSLRRPSSYDLVCCLYASFGFFDGRGNR